MYNILQGKYVANFLIKYTNCTYEYTTIVDIDHSSMSTKKKRSVI